jgi:hypothetical protein
MLLCYIITAIKQHLFDGTASVSAGAHSQIEKVLSCGAPRQALNIQYHYVCHRILSTTELQKVYVIDYEQSLDGRMIGNRHRLAVDEQGNQQPIVTALLSSPLLCGGPHCIFEFTMFTIIILVRHRAPLGRHHNDTWSCTPQARPFPPSSEGFRASVEVPTICVSFTSSSLF